MKKTERHWGILRLLPLVISIMTFQISLAQSTKEESGKIRFVSSWPTEAMKNHGKSFGEQLKSLILGQRDYRVARPVSALVNKKGEFWVLDQQSRAVFLSDKEEYKFPRYIERKSLNLASLVDIAPYIGNTMLVTDSYLNKIFVLDPDKKSFTALSDSLKLDRPTGIAYAPLTHEIWVSETGQHRILVLNEKGEIIRVVGKRGLKNGEFNFPTYIAIDGSGTIYIVDAMNFRVQIFDMNGSFVSAFGSNGDATGSFASPKGIGVDSYGHIYIADCLFHSVQIYDKQGNFLYAFGQQGQGEGQFWMPTGLFVDKNDHIYVSDSYNSRIQEFQLIMEEHQ